MTAPDTNVEKQAKRHRGPLIGIAILIVAVFVFALFFAGSDELNENEAAVPAAEATSGSD